MSICAVHLVRSSIFSFVLDIYILYLFDKYLIFPGKQLPWSTRLKIAMDSARGLEYIHDHTVQLYIHRDIKSANILLDKDLLAKVV